MNVNTYLLITDSPKFIDQIKINNPTLSLSVLLIKPTSTYNSIILDLNKLISQGLIQNIELLNIFMLSHAAIADNSSTPGSIKYRFRIANHFTVEDFTKLLTKLSSVPIKLFIIACQSLFLQQLIFNLKPGSQVITLTDHLSNITLSGDLLSQIKLNNIIYNIAKDRRNPFERLLIFKTEKTLDYRILVTLFGDNYIKDTQLLYTYYPCYYLMYNTYQDSLPLVINYLKHIYLKPIGEDDTPMALTLQFGAYITTYQKNILRFIRYFKQISKFYEEYYDWFNSNNHLIFNKLLEHTMKYSEHCQYFEWALSPFICSDHTSNMFRRFISFFMYPNSDSKLIFDKVQNHELFLKDLSKFLKRNKL